MTTRVELQKWLDQFPEDAQIEVITTAENNHYGFDSYTSVFESSLELTDMPEDFISYFYSSTFEVEKFGEKMIIRLGRKDT